MSANYLQECGNGEWFISTYNPSEILGPFSGTLKMSKDIYTIYSSNDPSVTIFAVPSPNVAYCINGIQNLKSVALNKEKHVV